MICYDFYVIRRDAAFFMHIDGQMPTATLRENETAMDALGIFELSMTEKMAEERKRKKK